MELCWSFTLQGHFCAQATSEHLRHVATMPEHSAIGVIASLPKAPQIVRKKWVMAVVSIQFKQSFQQLAHLRQVGSFKKKRQMLHHIWGVKGLFEIVREAALVTFDFVNVLPTLSHEFIQAVP